MDRCMTKSRRPGGFARVKLLDRMQIYGGGDRQDDSYRGAWWGMGEACLRLYARTSLTKSICGKNTWVASTSLSDQNQPCNLPFFVPPFPVLRDLCDTYSFICCVNMTL
jgi:hypothetical protein